MFMSQWGDNLSPCYGKQQQTIFVWSHDELKYSKVKGCSEYSAQGVGLTA